MSGYTNGILGEHAFQASDMAFIEKPFSQQSLYKKIRQTLEPDGSLGGTSNG
jgi:FixJ family two-component response regulator